VLGKTPFILSKKKMYKKNLTLKNHKECQIELRKCNNRLVISKTPAAHNSVARPNYPSESWFIACTSKNVRNYIFNFLFFFEAFSDPELFLHFPKCHFPALLPSLIPVQPATPAPFPDAMSKGGIHTII
jgi:hypothetical protein